MNYKARVDDTIKLLKEECDHINEMIAYHSEWGEISDICHYEGYKQQIEAVIEYFEEAEWFDDDE